MAQAMFVEEVVQSAFNSRFVYSPSDRYLSELDVRRMAKEGALPKDEKGIYTHEIVRDYISGKPQQGAKYYLEDSFCYLEETMQRKLEEAYEIEGDCKSRGVKRHLPTLVAIDFEISLCREIYRGFYDFPDDSLFLSVRQIKEAIADQMAAGGILNYLMDGGEGILGYIAELQRTVVSKSTDEQRLELIME